MEKPSIVKTKLNITLYALCYNEMKVLPFMVDYWRKYSNKIIVYDNGSTDGSVEFLRNNGVIVREYESNNTFNDQIHKDLKNTIWKGDKSDFVIVCDTDEILYCTNILETLQKMKDGGYTICKPIGLNCYSEFFPTYQEGKFLHEICTQFKKDHMFNKTIIFSPKDIIDINYCAGAHNCSPTGNIKYYPNENEVFLLHFKYLGEEYVINRYSEYKKRLSSINIEKKWGIQYSDSTEKIKETIRNGIINSKELNSFLKQQ